MNSHHYKNIGSKFSSASKIASPKYVNSVEPDSSLDLKIASSASIRVTALE